MTGVLDRDALAEALSARGLALDPAEFIAIFDEVVDATTDTITEAERKFLVDVGGVDAALLTEERRAAAQARVIVETARADAVVARRGLTTREVAGMLGTAPANVRRAAAHGDLYAAGRGRNREHIFPTWQFHQGQPVRGLREVIAVLPADMHPLDVEAFMTSTTESLGGRTPIEWLAHGGDPTPVVRLSDELGRS